MKLGIQRESHGIDKEIAQIQNIDTKIKTDLNNLKERLKINNEARCCYDCKIYQAQIE